MAKEENSTQNEGHNLLGPPSFEQLQNGRFKCIETGHELPAHSRDSYSTSKRCRIGLIDFALARNKPPLNMFRQHPISPSRLICKLTGVTVNKSEEHIWKHMNGRRFLGMLGKMEKEKDLAKGATRKENRKSEKIEDERSIDEMISEVRDSAGKSSSDSEDEAFWMPPARERWENDQGDEKGTSSDSGPQDDDIGEEGADSEEAKLEAGKLLKQAKRMSLEIGPSSFASRKKKKKPSSCDKE